MVRKIERAEQLSRVHETLSKFHRIVNAAKSTATFCLKDLSSTLIEARKSRMDMARHAPLVRVEQCELNEHQRQVADDAAALVEVATAIQQVVGEFRGYGYVAGAKARYEDDWMIANLEGLLRKMDCGEPAAQSVGDPGCEMVLPLRIAACPSTVPLGTQDVDMSAD
jgi:hypothetical protein